MRIETVFNLDNIDNKEIKSLVNAAYYAGPPASGRYSNDIAHVLLAVPTVDTGARDSYARLV